MGGLGLAPFVGTVPGAAVLRSDEIRRRLCDVTRGRGSTAIGWSVFDLSAGLLTGVPRRSDSGVAGTSLRVVAAPAFAKATARSRRSSLEILRAEAEKKRLVRARTDDDGGG